MGRGMEKEEEEERREVPKSKAPFALAEALVTSLDFYLPLCSLSLSHRIFLISVASRLGFITRP